MFYNKRIKKLEKEVLDLRGRELDTESRILDTERGLKIQTHLYLDNPTFKRCMGDPSGSYYTLDSDRKISISNVLEKLLSALGYEIIYDHKPEITSYTLKKTLIPQKQTKKK